MNDKASCPREDAGQVISFPPPRRTAVEVRDVVAVPLSGRYGAGHSMILDAADWPKLRDEWGSDWRLLSNGRGRCHVASSRAAVRYLSHQRTRQPYARLSRLLMGAQRGEVVLFLNHDPLDLRRSNMRVLSRSEAARWKAEQIARHEAA